MSYAGYSQGYIQANSVVSNEIRQEIQRFESVHPSIYAIYDLIEGIADINLQGQIRDHVVSIEDSFVNSQEWTLSRDVPELKLGIAGLPNSGKSALVHRYLTGSYMQEESPEGGRFKKEVAIDNQSYLLLIRDEGSEPDPQFTNWVDVVIFVFSVENEASFNSVIRYYTQMSRYKDMTHTPIILVGTQDSIDSDRHPRVIEESKAKQLEMELGARCKYYETCATYGLNVEHVFQDACHRAVQERYRLASTLLGRANGTTSTAGSSSIHRSHSSSSSKGGHYANPRIMFQQSQSTLSNNRDSRQMPAANSSSGGGGSTLKSDRSETPSDYYHVTMRDHSSVNAHRHDQQQRVGSGSTGYGSSSTSSMTRQQMSPAMSHHVTHPSYLPIQSKPIYSSNSSSLNHSPHERQQIFNDLQLDPEDDDQSTDLSVAELTPSTKRKFIKKLGGSVSLRKSNSFHGVMDKKTTPNSTPVLSRKSKKHAPSIPLTNADTNSFGLGSISTAGESGTDNLPTPTSTPTQTRKNRRRSNIFVNPRKDDGKDELGSGRSIPVKQGYLYKKGSKGLTKDWKKKYVTLTDTGKLIYHPNMHDYMEDVHGKEINLMQTTVKIPGQNKPRLTSQISNGGNSYSSNDNTLENGMNGGSRLSPRDSSTVSLVPDYNGDLSSSVAGVQAAKIESNTPHTRRKHRRAKSGSKIEASGDGNDSDGYEFTIVSLENKQWQFEAQTQEDRDSWIQNIERQILTSFQGVESQRKTLHDPTAVQAIRNMPGNNVCCDCGTPNPSWASLNLGSLICIECSGIHRNLGTHHSRVRSLELDEWPPDLTAVMLAIGNQRSNSIWEAKALKQKKPSPNSSREEKEQWIRAKYEQKEFLADRTLHKNVPLSHLLIDAIARQELSQVVLLLADSNAEEVSAAYSSTDRRTPLHIAAQQGNAIFLQLLLWYGADVKRLDQEGRSALWYAKQVGAKECAMILAANGCQEVTTLPRLRRDD